MISQERYEIIKKWGNVLFLFNDKEANQENKEKFKNILKKIVLTDEFEWKTNRETKSIVIKFALGEIEVKTENNKFYVSMDAETKKKLKEFKTEVQEEQKSLFQEADNSQEQLNSHSSYDEINPIEEKGEAPQEEIEIKEEETQPSEIQQEKKIEEEEELIGESIFLDFLGGKEEGW